MPHAAQTCPLGSVSSTEKEHAIGNAPYANSMSPSLFSSYPVVIQHCSCSSPQFPSLQIRLPVGRPFATFFHSFSLPLSAALFPTPQLPPLGADLLVVCDSHLLLVYPSSGTIFPHTWRPPREEGMGAHSLYQGLPLAAECSNPPCR